MKKILTVLFIFPLFLHSSNWINGSSNWNNAANWDAGIPNAPDAIANFPDPGALAKTVTLDISPVVGTLSTNGTMNAYTFSPATSTIHFQGVSPTIAVSNNPATFNCLFAIDDSTTFNINSFLGITQGLSGNGNLTKTGSGTLLLGTTTTYTGSTNLSAGTILIVVGNALPTGTDLTITGGTVILNYSSQAIGSLAGNAGSVSLSSPPLNPISFTVGSNDSSTIYSGTIVGSGKLVKTGSGTLTLSGNNTYNSGTIINDGGIRIGANNNLGTGSITINIATLEITNTFSMANTIAISGEGILLINPGLTTTWLGQISGTGNLIKQGTGTLVLSAPNTYIGETHIDAGILRAGIANAIADSSDLFVTGTFDLNNFDQSISCLSGTGNVTLGSATLTLGTNCANGIFLGSISGTGGLTKIGMGSCILSGTNSYTGPTQILEGTLQINIGNCLSTNTAVTSNALLDLNNFDQSIGSLAGSGTVNLGTAILTTGNDNTNTNFSGSMTGTGSLIKLGTGIFTLSGSNNYSGTTTIVNGTLKTGIVNTLPLGSPITVNGTCDLNGLNQNVASIAGSGNITLGSGILTTGNDDSSTIFSGIISGSGGVTKVGTGIFTLSGNNSYTGATNINSGTLEMGSTSALSTNTAVTANGTLDLNFFSQNIGSLSGSGNVILDHANLILGNNGANTIFSGVLSGTGGLVKVGSGTFTLSGVNTYGGATDIDAGKVLITGSIASDVSILPGATLGGNGTIQGDITNQGFLSPGGSIDTLNVIGNVVFNTGSTFQVEVSPKASDLLNVTGNVTIQPGANIEIIPFHGSYQSFQRFTLIQTTANVNGTFNLVYRSKFKSWSQELLKF